MAEFPWDDEVTNPVLDHNQQVNDPMLCTGIDLENTNLIMGLPPPTEGVYKAVKTELHHSDTASIPSSLGIKFKATDSTKSVFEEKEASSYRVRKGSKLNIDIISGEGPLVRALSLCLRFRFWISYQNISFEFPVEIQDPEMRKAGGTSPSLEYLSVFALSTASKDTKINWFRATDNDAIVAEVVNWNSDLFIKFKSVSSERQGGKGWKFNMEVVDQTDNNIGRAEAFIKSLKIIREGGVKRSFSTSTNVNLPLSPANSSGDEVSDKEEAENKMDLKSMSMDDLLNARARCRAQAMKSLEEENMLVEEMARRSSGRKRSKHV